MISGDPGFDFWENPIPGPLFFIIVVPNIKLIYIAVVIWTMTKLHFIHLSQRSLQEQSGRSFYVDRFFSFAVLYPHLPQKGKRKGVF